MAEAPTTIELDAANPGAWASQPFETLFSLSWRDVEEAQVQAVAGRFEQLRPRLPALQALATKQGVDRIESLEDAAPLLFDHRVYKSYPLSLVEKRQFDRLTAWLQRLTTNDVASIPMEGVTSVDAWIDRLDEHGMLMIHTTGTTGKLSFFPRSRAEWQQWQDAFFESMRAASGVDRRTEPLQNFYPGYRRGNTSGTKMQRLMGEVSAEGEEGRHCLYEYAISSDLLSMAARLRTAEERGELDTLELDPTLLEQRAKLIEAGRRREEDLERWFTKLAEDFRGQRVRVSGVTADLLRLALKGQELGIGCEFAPGSVLFTAGGLKGFKSEAPDDWEQVLRDFFGIERISSVYGMTEGIPFAPRCSAGYYHFFPYMVPLLLDPDGNVLPREGVQTGRFAFFDLLPASYWGGFISGDRVTMYWDEACECGWAGPRIDGNIARFSELEGGDDKISCAGTEEAYSEFMDYVSNV
jgi:hypothetical protein